MTEGKEGSSQTNTSALTVDAKSDPPMSTIQGSTSSEDSFLPDVPDISLQHDTGEGKQAPTSDISQINQRTPKNNPKPTTVWSTFVRNPLVQGLVMLAGVMFVPTHVFAESPQHLHPSPDMTLGKSGLLNSVHMEPIPTIRPT